MLPFQNSGGIVEALRMKNVSHDQGVTRLLLIGGRPRSGTTLLRDLCDLHPDIQLTHEFGTFLALNESYDVYRGEILRRWRAQPILHCRIRRSRRSKRRLWRWALSMRGHAFAITYLGRIRRYRQGCIELSAVEATLREVLPGTGIVGDKLPDYVHLLDELAPVNGLSSVMIYRDCRDVTSSHLKLARSSWRNQPWIGDQDTAEKIARLWVDALETMERHRDQIHIIRYEDLVREPRRELASLAEWVGVDPAGFPERSMKRVHANGIGKHREGLSAQELEAVMDIAGPIMARLGYV